MILAALAVASVISVATPAGPWSVTCNGRVYRHVPTASLRQVMKACDLPVYKMCPEGKVCRYPPKTCPNEKACK